MTIINPKLPSYSINMVKSLETIPWNIQQTNARALLPFTGTVSPVGAVIDTGLHTAHYEFTGRVFKAKSLSEENLVDTVGHGTHVAGIGVGKTKGMFPTARVMPLQVKFETAQTQSQIWDAFLAILDHNRVCADIDKVVAVNCSFGGGIDPFVHHYIRELYTQGVSVICAAGNSGDNNPETHECLGAYPGYHYEVISVGALNPDQTPAPFTSSFHGIDIAAPGVHVVSAWPSGDYMGLSGTSMAAPHIFGAVLLIKAIFRNKYGRWPSGEETERMLFSFVKPLKGDVRLVGRGALLMPSALTKTTTKTMDVAPFIKSSRTFTPARFVAESLGAYVDGSKLPLVTASLDNKTATFKIGSNKFVETDTLI